MTPAQFKANDSYAAPLSEYLKTPSGVELTRLMLETDAALELPPEIEKMLKSMDVMQMLAFNHAVLIGWRAACRFMQNMSKHTPAHGGKQATPFSDDPRVKEWDDQIAAHEAKLKADQTKTNTP